MAQGLPGQVNLTIDEDDALSPGIAKKLAQLPIWMFPSPKTTRPGP
jgi:hypothetical protein